MNHYKHQHLCNTIVNKRSDVSVVYYYCHPHWHCACSETYTPSHTFAVWHLISKAFCF